MGGTTWKIIEMKKNVFFPTGNDMLQLFKVSAKKFKKKGLIVQILVWPNMARKSLSALFTLYPTGRRHKRITQLALCWFDAWHSILEEIDAHDEGCHEAHLDHEYSAELVSVVVVSLFDFDGQHVLDVAH